MGSQVISCLARLGSISRQDQQCHPQGTPEIRYVGLTLILFLTLILLSPQTSGTFIRIAPNHVSIADLAALQLIYGHGTDDMKSDFYTVAVHFSGTPSVFTTRSREDHARKRKILSHVFAPKSVQNFEPIIRRYQLAFIKHWDDLAAAGAADSSGSRGSCNWVARDGRAWFDCMPCV